MLDERKLKVLFAIIDSHFLSGQPVGSRKLSKEYDFGVGSATIRNEMSDLEDKGYLSKPHTSAGRIPSDKAYRLYVDDILARYKYKPLGVEDLRYEISQGAIELNELIQNATKLLSEITDYTSMAIGPEIKSPKLKKFEIVNLTPNKLMLIIISDFGYISNSMVTLDREVDKEDLKITNEFINKNFIGLNRNEIMELSVLTQENSKIADTNVIGLIEKFAIEINQALKSMVEREFFYEGLSKILNFPEYEDFDKTKEFFSTIEDGEAIKKSLYNPSPGLFEITIGYENKLDELKDMSLITVNYSLNDKSMGKIGVIGPKRMDYLNLINKLGVFSKSMTEALKDWLP